MQQRVVPTAPPRVCQVLTTLGWLDNLDFQNAEPFIFIGIPGHALLQYIQQSPYERLVLRPGLELRLREDFLGTSWVDPLRQELLNAQVQVSGAGSGVRDRQTAHKCRSVV
jgi:hypothetical protein